MLQEEVFSLISDCFTLFHKDSISIAEFMVYEYWIIEVLDGN